MKIGGLQKFTLIDYPGKIACIVFTMGCNFRCPYCHNRELVEETAKEIPSQDLFDFLQKRKGQLEGAEITGGEPTIQSGLPKFLKRIKEIGYSTKLDTNGSVPEILQRLLEENLVDYIAMDVKASLENYGKAAGVEVDPEKIRRSIEIVKSAEDYEFRTTVVPGIVDGEGIKKIAEEIEGAERFYLQQFRPENTLDESYEEMEPYPEEKLKKFKEIAESYVKSCEVRNI